MLTIYGRANSSNVQLAMWAVNELGLEHERLDYGQGHASAKTPDYLAMNPMGLVPVLRDGDVTMFESAAILRYLGARYGAPDFWPADPAERGPLDTWAEWGKTTFAPAVLRIFVYEVRTAPQDRAPAELAAAARALVPLATILDARIGDGPWLGGRDFTFADIACGHILHRYYTLVWDRPDLPALAAYFERLQTRPAYRAHAMVNYDALRGAYPKVAP
ncbi:glutathione S-transferase [Pseudooceanicola sp. 216_PA32_1]|uniref:Glutathione S-transferase n=1 Tax=Pseudooceanicola pacificus TaxID=2676438 RepID=A0A844WCW0_9RHOB|nr:glutathione S-transferase family protein [Pseudooceanicola pacificus]MWB79273.1 glutathione S-transferase [Pseudooceanicola pacificus]